MLGGEKEGRKEGKGMMSRVGTGCSGYKIFGPPNQSGKIFGRSVEFGWSLVVTTKANYMKNKVSG